MEEEIINDENVVDKIAMPGLEEIPYSVVSNFLINPRQITNNEYRQLRDIVRYIGPDNDILSEIRKVERRVGAPQGTESRIDRIWRHFKLNNRMKEDIKHSLQTLTLKKIKQRARKNANTTS